MARGSGQTGGLKWGGHTFRQKCGKNGAPGDSLLTQERAGGLNSALVQMQPPGGVAEDLVRNTLGFTSILPC